MADEIRTTRTDEDAGPVAPVLHDRTDMAERTVPETVQAEAERNVEQGDSDGSDRARANIEATRARMSETIDEIEDVLLRKKAQIQNRLDVTAPVRRNPWPSMGIALGAGLVLGLLTGGDDEEELDAAMTHRSHAVDDAAWSRRVEVLEERTRRLLAIARTQQEEIRRLRGKKKLRRKESLGKRVKHRIEDGYDDLAENAQAVRSRLGSASESVSESIASFIVDAFRELRRR